MNLEKEILKEHSKAQTLRIVRYIGHDAERFAELVSLFLKGPYRLTQRSAWPLSICVEHYPELVKPHLKKLIKNLRQPSLHNAVKRNTMRLLQFVNIPKGLHGEVVSLCFDYLQDNKEAIAVRAFSMTVLANIVQTNPELKRELALVLEDIMPYGSAGLISRARKTLKQIKHTNPISA
ncbi:MAG: hypothetical protein KF845_11390 [Cyclobacteriaceae bacterium]|nr:hypothetical protein [Cyclobacteriaceae bacterium]